MAYGGKERPSLHLYTRIDTKLIKLLYWDLILIWFLNNFAPMWGILRSQLIGPSHCLWHRAQWEDWSVAAGSEQCCSLLPTLCSYHSWEISSGTDQVSLTTLEYWFWIQSQGKLSDRFITRWSLHCPVDTNHTKDFKSNSWCLNVSQNGSWRI